MAESKTSAEKIGLTRRKAALIGVLGIALVGVLYVQFGGSEAGDLPAIETSVPRAPLPRPAIQRPTPTTADEKHDKHLQAVLVELEQTRWKAPGLNEVIAYDPFALPASFPQPPQGVIATNLRYDGPIDSPAAANARQLADAVERLRRQLEELQQRGVHVIVNQRVAMIGDRTVHVGDEINGFTVTAIEPDGVRVEMKGAP